MVFVKPLIPHVQALLSRPVLESGYRTGGQKLMLSAQHMKSLPDFFAEIPDPRRPQGRRQLIRVDPVHLDRALQRWNQVYAQQDETLAIDGKTMCNAIDDQGCQTHIMSAIGHHTNTCYTQKKSAVSL